MPRRTPLGEDPFLRLNLVAQESEEPSFPGTLKPSPLPREERKPRKASQPVPLTKESSARKGGTPRTSTYEHPSFSPEWISAKEAVIHELWETARAILPPEERTMWEEGLEIFTELLRYLTPLPYYRAYQELILEARSLEVDPFGLDPAFEARLDRFLTFFYEKWWRVESTGVENIPVSGRGMIVANRGGIFPFDGAMLKLAVRILHPSRRTVRFLVENYFYYAPFLGVILTRYGAIRGSYDNARRLLRDQQMIAVFPEGIQGLGKLYRNRYQLQRFGRAGFIKLAMEERSPIIPAAIVGSEEIYPLIAKIPHLKGPFGLPFFIITPFFPWLGPLGLIPLPVKWRIIFGEPFLDHLRYDAQETKNELLLNQLNLKIRRIIHEFLYEELAQRRSLFFG